MLKIYGADLSPPSNKVRFVANELGLDYEYNSVNLVSGENQSEGHLKLHPAGKVPVIDDDGFVLWESGAIIRYLCATHSAGNLSPSDLQDRARAERWMDWSSLYLSSFNGVYLNQYFRLPAEERDESKVLQAIKDTSPLLDILDAQLADKAYLNGDSLTIADIPAGSLIHRWMTWSPEGARPAHPNVEACSGRWRERSMT